MKFKSRMRRKSLQVTIADRLGMRLLKLLIAFSVLFLTGGHAYAACSFYTTYVDTVINFPTTIYVPANVPANTIVASVTAPVTGASAGVPFGTCLSTDNLFWMTGPYGMGAANRVNPTSVQGIGYTANLSGGGFSGNLSLDTKFVASSYPGATINGSTATLKFPSQLSVTVNLVTTGAAIVPGKLTLNPNGGVLDSSGTPGTAGGFSGQSSGNVLFNVTVPSNATTISSPACSVTTRSPTVTLDPVAVHALTGVGSTAGSAPIAIGLTCGSSAKVYITLTDGVNTANVSNILSLKSGSTASGVAFQIFDPSGNPVKYGPDSSLMGNTNQWLAGTSSAGAMTIPLTVRYVQTGATVRPGSVLGLATFTMAYQ